MELWIRSQDKKRLYKVNELFVEKDIYKDWCIETPIGNDYIVKTGYYVCCNVARFGRYETEERALEVLDEIQNILKPQMILSKIGKPITETCDGWVYTEPNEYKIKELSTYVYEMPEN